MAAPITGRERRGISGQANIDLLVVGDVAVRYLADAVPKFFSDAAEVTITISDLKKALVLLEECTFHMVFLKVTSSLTAEELDAVKLIRFGKKKNTHLLFVFIIPENVNGRGADITVTEPLTVEKMSVVVKYWKTYFSSTVKNENAMRPEEPGLPLLRSCSEHVGYFSTDLFACSESLRNNIGFELKAPLSDFEESKEIPLRHSSKEKLRRTVPGNCSTPQNPQSTSKPNENITGLEERMKYCCEQLRALLPYVKGRKNDVASVLEATVDYVKDIREKIPPAVMGQITEALQSNRRFCKKRQILSLPGTVMAQREDSVFTSTYSPVRGIRLLANKRLNVYSVPAAAGSLDEAVRGQSSSTSENAIGELYKAQNPSTAVSLNSFHVVSYYSTVVPPYDATAIANQNISIHLPSAVPAVSKFLPQH